MKKILIILGLILLNLSLVLSANEFSPIVTLDAVNVQSDSATLLASAFDLYDNAQIEWIRIYQVGNPIALSEKTCEDYNNNLISHCAFSLDVNFPSQSSVSYYARAKDATSDYRFENSNIITIDLAPIISNIQEINIQPMSATIIWDTDDASTSAVRYGLNSGSYTSLESDSNLVTSHSIDLTNLIEGETYYYIVESEDIDGGVGVSTERSFVPRNVNAPIITNVNSNVDIIATPLEVTITWNTNQDSDSRVRYGTVSGIYDSEVSDSALDTYHDLLLGSLTDGETYYYVVESEDVDGNVGVSPERSFTTGRLVLNFREPDEDEEYFVGDTIIGELRVENADVSDIEVDVEIILYDETEDDELEKVEFNDKDIDSGEDRDFEFEFELPANLDEGNDYIIIAEVTADGTTYKQEINIDVERKANDVRIENMRVNRVKDRLEVNMNVVNYGKKDQENVFVEVTVFGLGLSDVSDDFELEDWEGSNVVSKRFVFSLPSDIEEGMYSVEAALHYSGSFDYVTKDFEVRESVSSSGVIEIQSYDTTDTSGLVGRSELDVDVMKFVTWGIVDFLLLCVVIYGFVWLIKNR